MADLTAAEVLHPFQSKGSVNDADNVLMQSPVTGGTSATKITAALLRSYLIDGLTPTIDNNGYLVIGGVTTEFQVAGVTPQLRRGASGIEVSTDGGTTWTQLIAYSAIAYFTIAADEETAIEVSENNPNILVGVYEDE